MEANEMEPGPWDECGQALQEFQRAHHEMGGAIAVRRFELEDDLAGRGAAQPFGSRVRIKGQVFQCHKFAPALHNEEVGSNL